MRKTFQSPQGLRTPVGRFKNNLGQSRLHDAALPGNTKFFLKVITNISDYVHRGTVFSRIIGHSPTAHRNRGNGVKG